MMPKWPASAFTFPQTSSIPSKFTSNRFIKYELTLHFWIRTLQEFKDEGAPNDEIAQMRLDYYEGKRKVYTMQIESTIRMGFLEDFKAENRPLAVGPLSKTAGNIQPWQMAKLGQSPKGGNKMLEPVQQDYGLQTIKSTLPPEIMLRDPLDQEFILNRKMAKKYYESQLQNKMQENQLRKQQEKEAKLKKMEDKQAAKEKHFEELRKMRLGELKETKANREAKLFAAKE